MAKATCSVDGCGESVRARSWCLKHYTRWRRHGDPLSVKPGGNGLVTPLIERIWRRIERRPDGCWEWTGHRTNLGYGKVAVTRDQLVFVHRAVYEILVEPIPDGLVIDHLCRNPSCCNPSHLEPVTYLENTRRGIGHGSETHCPQGHPYEGDNLYQWGGRRYCRACRRAHVAAFKAKAA